MSMDIAGAVARGIAQSRWLQSIDNKRWYIPGPPLLTVSNLWFLPPSV